MWLMMTFSVSVLGRIELIDVATFGTERPYSNL
jgi:hypothetical protein